MARIERHRIKRVRLRADMALEYLTEHGPSVLTDIADAIGVEVQRTRYALTTLRQDRLAHIVNYTVSVGEDRIPRHVAVFKEGRGFDAHMPNSSTPPELFLDFDSTAHLQPIYAAWEKSRTPDISYDDE